MNALAHVMEEYSNSVLLYVPDETAFRTESDNLRIWIPVGISPILESNDSHEGPNIIRATEITKKFDTIINVYAIQQSIIRLRVQEFIQYLLNHNACKKAFVIMDNTGTHNNK